MDFDKLFKEIGLADIGIESFYSIHKRASDKHFCDRLVLADILFKRGDDLFYPYLQEFAKDEGLAEEVLNLYIFLRKSERLLEEFKERGYGEELFYSSMRSIQISARYYYEKCGIYGTSPTHRVWFRRLFALGMFRFERLEFEPITSAYDVEIDGKTIKKGDFCVTVHIPRYDPLTKELCEKSYAEAREFFKKHYGVETLFIFCNSWLMHPWLSECLGENSKIASFQQGYKLLDVADSPDAVIAWAFPEKCENPDDYPENTSLQRAAKERIKKGLPLGYAAGVKL